MKIPFYYILLMLPILIQAQGGPLTLNSPEGGAVSFLTQNGNYADLDAEGSEYFDETYRMGEVTIRDKVELRGKMRFNAFRNEIQVLQQGDESFPLLKRSYIKAAIGKKVFGIYLYEDAKGNNRSSYFNPLNQGPGIENYAPFPAEAVNPGRGAAIDNSGTVQLEWTGSDVDNDIIEYEVFFGTDSEPSNLLGTTSVSFIDATIATGVYYWRVISRDSQGNSSQSEIFEFSVL